jgi:hypothetical protein
MTVVSKQRSKYGRVVAICLLSLLLSFTSFLPGGLVENRPFFRIGRAIFNGFNPFLIVLGLIGFLAVCGLWRGHRCVCWLAILVGCTFAVVVVLDLGKVFPVSLDPTGFALGLIISLDAILSMNVVLTHLKHLGISRVRRDVRIGQPDTSSFKRWKRGSNRPEAHGVFRAGWSNHLP